MLTGSVEGRDASASSAWFWTWKNAVLGLAATWCFVALGLVARVVRFLVNYPFWPDEAFVAANFLERGYGDLLGRSTTARFARSFFSGSS